MSLSKRGRRKIMVNGEFYYWLVGRPRVDWAVANDNNLQLNVVITPASQPSSKIRLSITGEFYRFLWLDAQNVVITPKMIRRVIEYALAHDWLPYQAGHNFVIDDAQAVFPELIVRGSL